MKYIRIFFILFITILVVGCTKDNKKEIDTNKEITIIVYEKKDNIIYEQTINTKEKYLLNVLKNIDELNIKTELGDYGEYIISINNIKQEDNYYWNYYVNDNYASVGISQYEIKNNDKITFKLEKFE